MIRPLLRSASLVALAVAPITLAACSGAAGGPAASVGDADISHEQVASDIQAFTFLSGLSGAPCGTPVTGESRQAACARAALTSEIQEEVVKAYASAHDLSVAPADVTGALSQLEQGIGGAEALDRQLADNELDRADLRALAQRLLLFNVVQEAILAQRLDEESLQALYEDSKQQFTTVEVAHVLLESKQEAEDVAAEATPENFARLAERHSIDPGSAQSGGSLGAFSEAQFRQQFDPTFVEEALALQPGEISDVVQTQFGFHVIELIRRDVAAFEDVREQLSAQQGPQVFAEWLRMRFDAVEIEVNPRYGRLDGDTGEVVPIRSTEEEPSASAPAGST